MLNGRKRAWDGESQGNDIIHIISRSMKRSIPGSRHIPKELETKIPELRGKEGEKDTGVLFVGENRTAGAPLKRTAQHPKEVPRRISIKKKDYGTSTIPLSLSPKKKTKAKKPKVRTGEKEWQRASKSLGKALTEAQKKIEKQEEAKA